MHAEYRYICNHHPCLPVEMLRNYKERSPKQTNKKELKKKKRTQQWRESYKSPNSFESEFHTHSWLSSVKLGTNCCTWSLFFLHKCKKHAYTPKSETDLKWIQTHDQIKLIFFSKRKISISMLLLAEHTLAIGVYDIIQFHQIIWPCGMEGSFWDGIIMALFFTVRSWVLRSECAWLAQEAKALRAGKHR